ncbi:MAG: AAA family ATPase [Bauldia sp.]|nr:AAA family ATPase [Bauldia sp.]MCW5717111.1 AAA family ATPase [Bauldia sp.]
MNQYPTGFRPGDPALETAIERAGRPGRARGGFDDFESPPNPFDIRSLLGLVRRQKWSILATIILGVGIGAIYVSQVQRQYTAQALLVVDTRDSEMLGIANGLNDTLGVAAAVATELVIIKSSSVLLRAAAALDLPSSPVFQQQPSRIDNILSMVGLGGDAETAQPAQSWSDLTPAQQRGWGNALGGHVSAGQRAGTNVLTISVTTPVPQESARWANAVAYAYLEEQILSKTSTRDRATQFLRGRVDSLAVDVGNIQGQIDDFIMQAIDRAGTPEARARLADLRNQLSLLDTQAANLDAIRTAMANGDLAALTALVATANPDLVQQRDALSQQLAVATTAQQQADIQRNLAALNDQIREAARARAANLEVQLAAQEDNIGALRADLNNDIATQTNALPNDITVDLFTLQQDATTTQALYSSYLSRLRQAEQEGGLELPDSRIIAEASTPGGPSYPSVRQTLLMAFLLSAAAGIGIALLRENLIGGIASIEHLEQVTGMRVVASVPKHRARKNEEPDWAVVDQPLSSFTETIRRARIGIESIVPDQQLRLVVTSSAPGEGKTTVALAIARSFAKSGKSTILIDADLRHPSVHKHVDRPVEVGLIDYLLRGRAAETAHLFMMEEEATGLNLVLGSEASSVATDSLILSQRFASVIDYASKEFEVVIIDSPPVGLVVDPQLIAREYATVALYIVKADSTSQRAVKAAFRDLAMHASIPIVGLLNQVSANSKGYGKYSSYYR